MKLCNINHLKLLNRLILTNVSHHQIVIKLLVCYYSLCLVELVSLLSPGNTINHSLSNKEEAAPTELDHHILYINHKS